MSTRNLLIEIGTEELPPKALSRLSQAFTQGIIDGLTEADLSHGEIKRYATPRRLAILIHGLTESQPDKQVERRGPSLIAAFDEEGCPSKAALGFAKSCGVEMEGLETLETDKGSWLVFREHQKGRLTSELIPEIVQQSLDKLPIPKRMRWSDLKVQFVRPVHWVVLLFGNEIIDAEILGIRSGRETRGHRFHHPDSIYLGEAVAYAPMLESHGHVIADFETRREAIRGQVLEIAATVQGNAVIDNDLLDEVTSMVEWPVAILGNFEQRFLEVPAEALISAMKGHQKYFHVVDGQGKLMPHFITVSNIESKTPDVVRSGNERVIRPRLSDADFFWNQDRNQKLEAYAERLKTVVFQSKLGTLFEKSQRVGTLAGVIAAQLGGDPLLAERAGQLCKCDLMTNMVGEFPELQGIMGRYYAQHDGEPDELAQAIDEHYMPRFAGDQVPATTTGQAVAIAEKLDTLTGIFGIGQIPTGDKDPFALRRAALGLLRIIIERRLDLDLAQLVAAAATQYSQVIWKLPEHPSKDEAGVIATTAKQVFDFVMERLRVYYLDQGIPVDVFEAVYAEEPTQPMDFDARVRAVTAFRDLPEAASLAAANKRISNILKKAGVPIPEQLDHALLTDKAEKALAEQLDTITQQVEPLFADRDYTAVMKQLTGLRDNVDNFFDEVMVMAEDTALRDNRLALLKRMRNLFLRVADLSCLQ